MGLAVGLHREHAAGILERSRGRTKCTKRVQSGAAGSCEIGISRRASCPHFGTHHPLIEAGYDVRTIQEIWVTRRRTTRIYTHVLNRTRRRSRPTSTGGRVSGTPDSQEGLSVKTRPAVAIPPSTNSSPRADTRAGRPRTRISDGERDAFGDRIEAEYMLGTLVWS